MSLAFTLAELAVITGGRVASGPRDAVATRFRIDSRAVERGDFFVAIKGERQDGHDFAAAVSAQGAGGLVLTREVPGIPAGMPCLIVPDAVRALQEIGRAHRRKFSGRVVGITGSNGKTTTKEMLSQVLSAAGKAVLATRGNLNSQIGLPLMLMELDPRHTHAVLEMGASQKGDIARLAALAGPQVGVITNVGRAHLEFFGSPEAVLEAKWEMAASLPDDGIAVLNADDPALMGRRKELRCPVVTFGMGAGADVRAENVRQEPEAVFDLSVGGTRREVRLSVAGVFNVYNALAAAAVALWERTPLDRVAEALSAATPPAERMQTRHRADGSILIADAYNANPSSMRASLESFARAYPDRRRIAVLGSMRELGPYAEREHRALGELLASLPLERAYFLGEEASWVREGFESAGGRIPLAAPAGKDALRAELKEKIGPDCAVLFKASRGVKLEDVYEPLLEEA